MKFIFLSIFVSLSLFQFQIYGQAEKPCSIAFNAVYGQEKLSFENHHYTTESGNTLQFSTLKFYISKLVLINNDKIVWEEKNSYHLIDASIVKSLFLALDCPEHLQFNKVQFQLGIDSSTNVSGAMGGDLDPSKGMYWAWQSGYINFKLEGTSDLCNTRDHEFQFHLGGYLYPFTSIQVVSLNVLANNQISIDVDLKEFIKQLDLSRTNQIMTPSFEAKELSAKAISIFKIHHP